MYISIRKKSFYYVGLPRFTVSLNLQQVPKPFRRRSSLPNRIYGGSETSRYVWGEGFRLGILLNIRKSGADAPPPT